MRQIWVMTVIVLVSTVSDASASGPLFYDISSGSFYGTGCFDASGGACPTITTFDLNGTLCLELTGMAGSFEEYDLEITDWMSFGALPFGPLLITGTGTYQVDPATGAQSIVLDLDVGGVPTIFESAGVVDGGDSFPGLLSIVAASGTVPGEIQAIWLSGLPIDPPTDAFRRGDANGDGGFDVSDPIFVLGALFIPGSPAGSCLDALDSNDDGNLDIADATFALSALFVAGAPPPGGPFPDCGLDPTADALDCAAYVACP